MSVIDWTDSGIGSIGAFKSVNNGSLIFAATKEHSNYGGRLGFKGLDTEGREYHVFAEYWSWQPNPIAPWTGEGLPPVGTVCDVFNEITGCWDAIDEVLAHTIINGSEVAVFKRGEYIAYSPANCFRPIKTPEQIAAEARQMAIDEMVNEMRKARYDQPKTDIAPVDMANHYAAGLYDAGYRRVTPWND